MNFSDLLFLYAFLPLCVTAYFISKNIRWRNAVLLIFALIFYAWGDIRFLPLLVCAALVNYGAALLLSRFGEGKRSTAVLAVGIILNLGLLGVFKYTGFVIENINAAFDLSIASPNL